MAGTENLANAGTGKTAVEDRRASDTKDVFTSSLGNRCL